MVGNTVYLKQQSQKYHATYKIYTVITDFSTLCMTKHYMSGFCGLVLKYTYAAIIAEMASKVGRTIVNKRSLCFEKSSRRSRFSLCVSFTLPFSCFILSQMIQTVTCDRVHRPYRKQDIR